MQLMAGENEKRPSWYLRGIVHAILATGAIFFLLPLVWMAATSLKPLSETMKYPESVSDVFFGKGDEADIDGTAYPVVRERDIRPTPETPFHVVRPKEPFSAGELWLTFGPEIWKKADVFSNQEKTRMNTEVGPAMKVLADDKNRFDPKTGILTLRSGRKVPADLVREVTSAPPRPPATEGGPPVPDTLWLVREWRPEDTDTKEVGSTGGEVTRAWDVVPDSQIRRRIRIIPQNYQYALARVNFSRCLLNTLFLCVMCVGGAVCSSVVVAYGFAFLDFRGRGFLFGLTVATMMIPFAVTMIPVFLLYRELGWTGTFKPLWVATWFGSAFFIFLLRQFFLGLPKDLLDAARIDGCTELEILWHVVVPLSRPAIAMVALFTFLGTWKDFMGPLIYLRHQSQFTLSLSLQAFHSEHGGTPWHLLMAASTVFSLPLIILFFAAMKTFIRGIAMTGIKG
ncbi:MAG TPA: carbohydrate ABC transporter permease [Phycisphaerae bacterium]|nr:carbohydrate ABC transporter permease [Phycisphaerae bacterium]